MALNGHVKHGMSFAFSCFGQFFLEFLIFSEVKLFAIFLMLLQLFLGIIICMMSLHMYFAPAKMLVDLPVTNKVVPEGKNDVAFERTAS